MIRKAWQLGFTQFELCRDSRSAGYLCKYLAKDMLWRVRASKAYGQEEDSEGTEPRATPEEREVVEASSREKDVGPSTRVSEGEHV